MGFGVIHLGKKIMRRFDKQGNFAVAMFHNLVLQGIKKYGYFFGFGGAWLMFGNMRLHWF